MAPVADRLDPERIARTLDRLGTALGRPVRVLATTGSTNDDARAAVAAGAPHGAAILADEQTAGRGRSGSAWHSPPGEGVLLSVVLRPRLPAADLGPLGLVVGLAVARVVERALPPAPALPVLVKWPNDVLVAGRKVAGVLVEARSRGSGPPEVVAGIGLNVHAARFPDAIAGRATSLRLLGCEGLDRSELAALLIAELGRVLADFEQARVGPFLAELGARDALRGRTVRVEGLVGTAAGLDELGRLLVRTAQGCVHAVVAGQVECL
ncbi:MAG: biotin--[acetyl-CoA-carboxylase] ligase [Deltaproteobacteria bacterium]|nr:biotin--[acetyl-CoA-carboxylase] ligase [Deltaproteobacteria bacterium]